LLESSEVVVGREDDVYKVMKLLIGSIGQQVQSVVPIVGMAGLGKTTIAKKVCQLVREKKHFDVTLWVCVSNDFSKRRILGEMLQKIDKSTGVEQSRCNYGKSRSNQEPTAVNYRNRGKAEKDKKKKRWQYINK
jgi:Cdc6-like AAA superfamily ATPase